MTGSPVAPPPRPPEIWTTPRLTLRPPALDDAEAIFRGYAQDPEVVRYLLWRPHRSVEDTRVFLERCRKVWSEGADFPWVIQLASGEVAGMLEMRMQPPAAQLGYVLARARWGQGLMTEALEPVVAWALSQTMIYRVWAVCDVANLASARVLERLGFEREGTLRRWISHPNAGPEPRDALCYSRVR